MESFEADWPDYTPDVWEIVVITNHTTGESTRRVLAGWYGGYAGSDSWKLSSGIVREVDTEKYTDYHNHSGSIYRCYKGSRRMSALTHSVFARWVSEQTETLTIHMENG